MTEQEQEIERIEKDEQNKQNKYWGDEVKTNPTF